MKFLALAIAAVLSSSAFAETQIACWDIKAKRGSRPILTAEIGENNQLVKTQLELTNEYWFAPYSFDKIERGCVSGPKNNGHKFSEIHQPPRELNAQLITTKRSPYFGNNEYKFELGTYFSKSSCYSHNGTYEARLILPTNLSNEFLKTFRIRKASERSNAVMVIPPVYDTSASGDSYLRMFCTSR